jgi:hypothetical protein
MSKDIKRIERLFKGLSQEKEVNSSLGKEQ